MKKRWICTIIAFCIVLCVCVFPSSLTQAQYNDEKYANYVNMNQVNDTGHAKYIIPNLYRQDASYKNVKTFPLVVNNSTEYFPLDVFALYSYLEVVYSRIANGFYINNTRNGHFVAFDLDTGTTTTHDNQILEIQAQIFHRTHYVPAKAVCEILGMTFETYDDPANGVRAARISDSKAKYTLEELVKMYSPVKKEPVTQNPDTGVTPDDKNKPPVQEKPDPYKNVAARKIYLTFENCPDSVFTKDILNVLNNKGQKAIFFLEKDKILKFPDTVRRIIAEGHSVGLYLSAQASQADVYPNEQLIEMLDEANDALCLVTKTKTRFVRFAYGSSDLLSKNNFYETAKENGYVVYDWTVDSQDYTGRTAQSYETIVSGITSGNNKVKKDVFIRFGAYYTTAKILEDLIAFCDGYTQFGFVPTDEYVVPPVFGD